MSNVEYMVEYMSFTINNKLSFIDSFLFLSSPIDSLVENLRKEKLLVFEPRIWFYPDECMSDFEKFKELPREEKFYSYLTERTTNNDK